MNESSKRTPGKITAQLEFSEIGFSHLCKEMKIEEMVKPIVGDHCLICGAPPAIIGIFTPSDPLKWGAASGKSRLIRYCLCEKCKVRADTAEKVEKVLLAELAGGGVTHAI